MSRERVMLRVEKGCLVPADQYSKQLLRERGYRTGDVLAAELRKPRNPAFHRLAHAFGQLCADNIEAFSGLGCHSVLKRIQLEGGIGCDEMALNFPGIGPCVYRIPQSLAFESMDEGQFHEVFAEMCRYVADRYWPDLTPEQVEQMASVMVEQAA
jgi:hypothetical protein